jgi:hypothetical protein
MTNFEQLSHQSDKRTEALSMDEVLYKTVVAQLAMKFFARFL